LIGTPTTLLGQATTYLQISFLGILFLFGYNFVNTVSRALGDSKTPIICKYVVACPNKVVGVPINNSKCFENMNPTTPNNRAIDVITTTNAFKYCLRPLILSQYYGKKDYKGLKQYLNAFVVVMTSMALLFGDLNLK
jgi:Na+-driven multidrug efflux pump